jgi:hypothetical protein
MVMHLAVAMMGVSVFAHLLPLRRMVGSAVPS